MRRPFLLIACVLFSACSREAEQRALPPQPAAQPSLYRSLAEAGARIDSGTAREMISQYRRNNGLGEVVLDEKLRMIAQQIADDMARHGGVNPQASHALERRLTATGLRAGAASANFSAGYHTLAEAFSGWRQSPPHNARMLAPRARRMGIATAFAAGEKYRVFWVLLLAE
jgi:uncharacterized protein YkwD